MEFVSKPVPMKARADNHFRFCILSLDSRHHPGSGCLICNVHLVRLVLEIESSLGNIASGLVWSAKLSASVTVIDLFAGPGGLGEGFSSLETGGFRPFRIGLSVEKESSAHRTLELRSFFRQFKNKAPEEYYQYLKGDLTREELFAAYPTQSRKAIEETLGGPRALGDPDDDRFIRKGLKSLLSSERRFVLIGGPPCQAYSLVGRARNRGISGYKAEDDHRHFLYREYLNVLNMVEPEAFVMENVKGILSSKIQGQHIFPTILEDLADPAKALSKRSGARYRIFAH